MVKWLRGPGGDIKWLALLLIISPLIYAVAALLFSESHSINGVKLHNHHPHRIYGKTASG